MNLHIQFEREFTIGSGDGEDIAHVYLTVDGEWVLASVHAAPEGAVWVGPATDQGGDVLTMEEVRKEFE